MKSQTTFQTMLRQKLLERQFKNPSYSLRALARSLNLNPAVLSMILNGKRKVSRNLVERVSESLMLAPDERAELLKAFDQEELPTQTIRSSQVQLSTDEFRLISEWYHFAILSLADTEAFLSDESWIARRLGISKTAASEAIERLVRLGMLKQDKNKKLSSTGVQYKTTTDVVDLSLRKSHLKNLELARVSLESDPIEERDFSAVTMAIDPKLLPEAKNRIRQFRQELSHFLESGRKQEIYKICLQLFPISHKL